MQERTVLPISGILRKCKPLNWYKGIEQNIGKTAENKGFRHIGWCWNPLFAFGAGLKMCSGRQRGCSFLNPSQRAFEPRGQRKWTLCGRFEPSGQKSARVKWLRWSVFAPPLVRFDILWYYNDLNIRCFLWNHSEHRGLTNRIRRNAKITKIEMWNTIGWNIKMRIVSAFFDFLVE